MVLNGEDKGGSAILEWSLAAGRADDTMPIQGCGEPSPAVKSAPMRKDVKLCRSWQPLDAMWQSAPRS